MSINYVECFAGLGSLSHAFEDRFPDAKCIGIVEANPACRAVLARHRPEVKQYDDVRTAQPGLCDVVLGGFPCQNISRVNRHNKEGIRGEKSSLFFDMMRLAWQSQAHTIIMENVPTIKSKGLYVVREACEALGYSLSWKVLAADQAGAPVTRHRWFAVASKAGWRVTETYPKRSHKPPVWPAPMASCRGYTEDALPFFRRQVKGYEAQGRYYGCILPIAARLGPKWRSLYPQIIQEKRLDYPWDGRRWLNPDWVERLVGLPTGYTKPTGRRLKVNFGDPWAGRWDRQRLVDEREDVSDWYLRLKMLGNTIVPQQARYFLSGVAT